MNRKNNGYIATVLRRMERGDQLLKYFDDYRFLGEEVTIALDLGGMVRLLPGEWMYDITEEGYAHLRKYDGKALPNFAIPGLLWFKRWEKKLKVQNLHLLPDDNNCWHCDSATTIVCGRVFGVANYLYQLKYGAFAKDRRLERLCGSQDCVNPLHRASVERPTALARRLIKIQIAARVAKREELVRAIIDWRKDVPVTDEQILAVRRSVENPVEAIKAIFEGTKYPWTYLNAKGLEDEVIRVYELYQPLGFEALYSLVAQYGQPSTVAWVVGKIGGDVRLNCNGREYLPCED